MARKLSDEEFAAALTPEIKDRFHPTRFLCPTGGAGGCGATPGNPCTVHGRAITGVHAARATVAAWAIDDHLSGEPANYTPGPRVPA